MDSKEHTEEDFWERAMFLTGCSEIEREKATPKGAAVSLNRDRMINDLDYQLISDSVTGN
jgi:hypothetical protein